MPGTIQAKPHDLECPLRCLSEARYSIIWGVVGAARACLDEAIGFSGERKLFGAPLSTKQETQRKLVWMLNETENAQMVALQLAKLKERKALSHVHISLGKYNNVDSS